MDSFNNPVSTLDLYVMYFDADRYGIHQVLNVHRTFPMFTKRCGRFPAGSKFHFALRADD
jgi:hypothetical protein